jgi:hypothetical protein
MPVPQSTDKLRICGVCAHNNSAAHSFCGMCGAPLENSIEASPEQVADAVTLSAARLDDSEPARDTDPLKRAIEPPLNSIAADGNEGRESPWMRPDIALPSFAISAESEPADRRYRLYLGVVLALVLALLLYMARRGTRTISGTAGAESSASMPTPSAPPGEPTTSVQPSTIGSAAPEANPPDSSESNQKTQPADSRTNQSGGRRPSSPGLTIANSSPPTAAEQSGAEELTTAEKYLRGVQGMPRDSREASLWLWKAVGKGNLAATVALSDLYLRGDGVPKNCDQARLLLDAAARKGGKAAAERLRNLQAFGCD